MHDEEELALFSGVAARLKHAHERVRALDVSDAERAALTRRLLVITDAAKHDLRAAAERLDLLVRQLEQRGESPQAGNSMRHKGDSSVR